MTESGITIRQDVDTAQQQFNDREFARVRNFSHLVEHSNFVSEAAFKSLKREDQQEVMRFWHLEAASFLELARNESDPIVALTDIVGAKQVIERKYFGGSKNKSALRTEAAEPQIVLNGTDHLYLPAVMWTDIGDYNMQAYALTGDESFAQEAEENFKTAQKLAAAELSRVSPDAILQAADPTEHQAAVEALQTSYDIALVKQVASIADGKLEGERVNDEAHSVAIINDELFKKAEQAMKRVQKSSLDVGMIKELTYIFMESARKSGNYVQQGFAKINLMYVLRDLTGSFVSEEIGRVLSDDVQQARQDAYRDYFAKPRFNLKSHNLHLHTTSQTQ